MEAGSVNKFINSRYLLLIAGLLSIGLSYAFYLTGLAGTPVNSGISDAVNFSWTDGGIASWGLNFIVILNSVLLLGLLNKKYAFVREYTMLHISFFLIAAFSNPCFSSGVGAGTVTCFLVMACALILFGSYQQPKRRGVIFLISFILSGFSIVDYSSLLLLPVFFVGFFQMQTMTFKGFIAMLLGIITPYWLAWGFGFVELNSLRLPDMSFSLDNYAALSAGELARASITVIAGLFFGLCNVLTLMSYRLQLRSYNGFFTALAVVSAILMVLDVRNFDTYLLLLNVCVSVQAAHFFTIHKFELRYVLFFLFVAAYLACVAYDLIIPVE